MHPFRYIFPLLIILMANSLSAKPPVFKEKEYMNHPPRIIRSCCAFGTDLKVSIVPVYRYTMLTSANNLGPHKYLGDRSENNGILYTRRGGFLDFGHLRDLIDWTAYFYNLAKKSQETGEILLHLGFESGEKALVIKVPPSETEEDLISLAARIAYDLSIWHEITTWFGASSVPLVSERFSSFSLEDAYSNLLGTRIASEAISSDLPYEEAVTGIIKRTLTELEAVATTEESYQAMEAVRDIWWTRKKNLPNNMVTLQRELDVYSAMTPWLVPGWESQNKVPFQITLPATTRDGIPLSEFYTLSFDISRKVPVKKIFPDKTDKLVTQNDFPVILDYIGHRMLETNIYYKRM